ncbi:hypothetical protein Bca52824_039974 [Brassica carinata]|uniref:Uncharacterized protein n=1 Tax=Brassica carinata TaxID=52824 RepID=A0A8X7RUM6_BRACI|nr:hypothetical protein Bca52824_039974 [Brassica carinata]
MYALNREDYGGNDSSDTEDREVEDLIRRDQAELNYNYAATVQYPPQPRSNLDSIDMLLWWSA